MKTNNKPDPTSAENFFSGLVPTKVTAKQVKALKAHRGKMVSLKADRVLGVGRERVQLISVNTQTQTARIRVPGWGIETAPFYMFVKLY